jgi:hypothetical protein
MIKRVFYFILIVLLVSCSPTSWLKLEILSPAEFTFPDTGKIAILNASYLPWVLNNKSNLITQIPPNEQFIFDTLITTNLFNGFFSILNESPSENLRNADYEEIRTVDTTNIFGPLSNTGVAYLCKTLDSKYLVSLEYYEFNRKKNEGYSFGSWESNLEVPFRLIWRIYNNQGILIDQVIDSDSLFWVEDENNISLPELTDAVREVFFLAGERYGKHISPYWATIARMYFLISRNGDDISFDKDQLLIYTSSKKKSLSFRASYNLAVLSESEDNLQDAIKWLDKAVTIMPWESVKIYRDKLENRIINRKKIELQSGKIN